jgi:type II secretory pathway component GspD/PulD (secretin)
MRYWLIALYLISCMAAAADMQIYTIPLQNQPPENLTVTLKPLIPEGGYLSSHGNNIIVRTTAENLAELQLLIDQLDQPLAQVMISLRRGNQYNNDSTQFKVNGTLYKGTSINNNGSIVINTGGRHNNTNTTITTRHTTGAGSGNNNYQVRGLEGRPSYIQTGSEVPITTVSNNGYGWPQVNQDYKAVNQGFYATPRLYGERVTIDISTQHDTVDNSHRQANNTVINTESVNTSVSGRLGEWIAIGGFDQNEQSKDTGLTKYRSTNSLSSKTIYLKVEKIN